MILTKNIPIVSIFKDFWWKLLLIIFASTLSFIVQYYFLREYFTPPGMVPTVLGTALAFFIGFNNNQAYDRWWEARKIWGALVNDSRTWARQILNYTSTAGNIGSDELDDIRTKVVRRHIAFLYALKENLRESNKMEYKKYLSQEEFELIESRSNKHNAILDYQSKDLSMMRRRGVIDGYGFLELNKSLIAFCDEMGMSERIKNTVFPAIYHRYTGMFIWIFIVSVTVVSASSVGPWSILLGTLIGLVYAITHKLGLALLNPFDEIITGIPLNQITRTIEINLLETLGELNIPEPVKSKDDKYIM